MILPNSVEESLEAIKITKNLDWISIVEELGEDPKTFFSRRDLRNLDFSMSDMSGCSFDESFLDGATFKSGNISTEQTTSAASSNNITYINYDFDPILTPSDVLFCRLITACVKHDNKKAMIIAETFSDLNKTTQNGSTALMVCCQHKNSELCLFLIEKMKDVDQQDEENFTALMLACCNDLDLVALSLIEKMESVHHQNSEKSTALMLACRYNQTKVALALIDKLNVLDQQNSDGKTALMTAINYGNQEVVEALIEEMSFVDQTDVQGWTAFMHACHSRSLHFMNLLLDAGANYNHAGNDGQTALQIAAVFGHVEQIQILLMKEDLDLYATTKTNDKDFNALDIAEWELHSPTINQPNDKENRKEVIKLLKAAMFKRGRLE